jgi:hypothetical protein
MGTPSGFFLQQSGSAQITLTRDQDAAQGPLPVDFKTDPAAPPLTVTGDKTIPVATPGQQYVPVDETVTFQPGQTTLDVSVPIVQGAFNPGIVQVAITATPLVTAGSAETGYFAIVTGPDQLPLTINNAQIVREASGPWAIALTFNEPLSPTSVDNLQNYRITPTGRFVRASPPSGSSKPASTHREPPDAPQLPPFGGVLAAASLAQVAVLSAVGATYKNPLPPLPMRLQSATYDAATNTITLVTAKRLNPSEVYQVAIGSGVGTPGLRKHNATIGNLTSDAGNSLSWDSHPATLAYPPAASNLVDLTLNPFFGFIASPASFNVSSRSSGPPQLAPWSRPSNAPIRYTLSM